MNVKLISCESEVDAIVPIMNELRPQYSEEQLKLKIVNLMDHGYKIAYAHDGINVMSVGGFVFRENLALGKHVYLDDLVTNGRIRSQGAGKTLLNWIMRHAKTQGCTHISLDSHVTRFEAHRFYLREGFHIVGHHFEKAL